MQIRTFTVRPSLPARLAPLPAIARNIYWTWTPDAIQLFTRIDPDLWEAVYHNPLRLLNDVSQKRLEELAQDDSFLTHMEGVQAELQEYLASKTWYTKHRTEEEPQPDICYFSAEFGLHESIPIYSGGLGLLAGDHLKSASDLGIPMIGLGLLYRTFFRQYLNADGWQQEIFPETDFSTLPIERLKDAEGRPIHITVDLPGRVVTVHIWRLNVGRTHLYLMDTNIPENTPEDREITSLLYGGDQDMRIRQEIVLGVGGVRALRAMGMNPNVTHMNDPHPAFLSLERIRNYMAEQRLSFAEATEMVSASNVFTTHTPVPAGNDIFSPDLVDYYFKDYYPQLGLGRDQFLGLGRKNPFDKGESFHMGILALRMAAHRNGVSELHGQVSRHLWASNWPNIPDTDIPIGHITNGVHAAGWVSHELAQLYTRYLGPRWRTASQDTKTWERVERVPDAELWRTHERRRERLVEFARTRLRTQLSSRGALHTDIERAREVLDPEALTLGFARRFATYKRGALLFSDPDRLARILNDKEKPVQIIFAGKAHPKDTPGKEVIKKITQFAREPRFRNRIVFIEDYDITVAHYLVQGVDVWVNNPRRPLEASGTSGMKAAVNGVLQCSILDGWWVEGYQGDNGWAIGNGEEYSDLTYQDMVESRALYDLIEGEITPLFYQRGQDDLPRGWIQTMKRSIRSISPVFNTNRMVIDYFQKVYTPAANFNVKLSADQFAPLRTLSEWKSRIRRRWMHLEVLSVEGDISADLKVGEEMPIKVWVRLGEIQPEEVAVEVFYGPLDAKGQIRDGQSVLLQAGERREDGACAFEGRIGLAHAGRCGYGFRILPTHPMMAQKFEPGLVLWG